jgi:hypothetical protein
MLHSSTSHVIRRRSRNAFRVRQLVLWNLPNQTLLYQLDTFTPHNTMARAESSKDAENNGVKANAQGAPSNYELPW